MATQPKAEQLLTETPINPKTGRVWSLADAEVAGAVAKLKKAVTKDRSTALQFLQDQGFVTGKGKLTKRYGG